MLKQSVCAVLLSSMMAFAAAAPMNPEKGSYGTWVSQDGSFTIEIDSSGFAFIKTLPARCKKDKKFFDHSVSKISGKKLLATIRQSFKDDLTDAATLETIQKLIHPTK